MAALALVGFLSTMLFFLYRWAFVHLAKARWQMLASVPVSTEDGKKWKGINFTFYGVFNALSYTSATALVVLLSGSIGVSGAFLSVLTGLLLGVCVPASRLMARLVEKKKHTLSVGGAVFVGTILAPWMVLALGEAFENPAGVVPVLAVIAIAYALGEGMGRLACISFGCCYGRPVASFSPFWRKKLERFGIVFMGETQKACYAGGLEGVPLVPVQAMTALLYSICALVSMSLFFLGFYISALWTSMLGTQLWRFYSEFLRSDYRGRGKISAYQWMSLFCAAYALVLPFFLPASSKPVPDIYSGLVRLWSPHIILMLQAVGVCMFLFTGKSEVTGASLRFHVRQDRI